MAHFIPKTFGFAGLRVLSSTNRHFLKTTRLYSSFVFQKQAYFPAFSLKMTKLHTPQHTHGSCRCCGYHTEGDKQMVTFLSEEISMEKQSMKNAKLPSLEGFEVERKEAEVILTKRLEGETIKVRFNVNHTVDTEDPVQGGDEESQMVSKPPFSVEITKTGQDTLTIQCAFPPADEMDDPSAQEGDIVDEFDIEEIALHGVDWDDSTYVVSAATMDGNLYDLLMTMLEDRGIDNTFANQLVNFSTAYEHNVYVNFLENLQKFVDQK